MAEKRKLLAPYLEWAVATDFAFIEGEWFNVLLDVDESAARFAESAARSALEIFIAPAYLTPPRELTADDSVPFSAVMSKKALRALLDDGETNQFVSQLQIRQIELGTPAEDPSRVRHHAAGAHATDVRQASGPKPSVIVAVIDDGLAFAHERFRDANHRTRFKFFWNQDDRTGSGTPPLPDFHYGRELTEHDINQLLGSCSHANLVDEDELYRRAGQRLAERRCKHGTSVMDIACGLDPEDVTSESPCLIGVQLPSLVTERTSGVFLTHAVRDALQYILKRAERIADDTGSAPLPIVVNFSYGIIAGPHDGSGPLETSIDRLVALRQTPLRVVLPAGNHYLARCHAQFELSHGSAQTLRWRVQPDNKAASFMEIWLPTFAADGHTRPDIEIRVTTPTREMSHWIGPGECWRWPSHHDTRAFVLNSDSQHQRRQIFLALAPTATLDVPRAAPSGTWLVEVRNRGADVAIDAWIQRGDTPFGYPLWGRQSRFDDANYQRFDVAGRAWQVDTDPSHIRRRFSINALATGTGSIVVGGYRRSDKTASEYSGSGPTTTPASSPPRIGPDVAATSDDSPVLHGLLAAGTRSGSVAALSGSSVAAPQVTRRIAELMLAALANDRAAVQVAAAVGDANAPGPGTPLRERLGTGRIDRPEPASLRWRLRY